VLDNKDGLLTNHFMGITTPHLPKEAFYMGIAMFFSYKA